MSLSPWSSALSRCLLLLKTLHMFTLPQQAGPLIVETQLEWNCFKCLCYRGLKLDNCWSEILSNGEIVLWRHGHSTAIQSLMRDSTELHLSASAAPVSDSTLFHMSLPRHHKHNTKNDRHKARRKCEAIRRSEIQCWQLMFLQTYMWFAENWKSVMFSWPLPSVTLMC